MAQRLMKTPSPESSNSDRKVHRQDTPLEEDAPALAAASDHRRLLLLRGIAALLLAFLVFFWPKLTIIGLAILWGGYSLVDGVLALVAAIGGRRGTPRAWLGLIGLAGIACAGGTLFALDEVSGHLVGIISLWAILTGAMQVWSAIQLRKAVDGHWILVFDGLGALLFGLALAFWPNPPTEALLWLIGWFAAAIGSLLVSVSHWLGRTAP
jgi:uncharacterized membrane protein HdeD (DUF308 family)